MVGYRDFGGISPSAYAELLDYLRASGNLLSPGEAITAAVIRWLEAQREADQPEHGYLWKGLFLPAGSRARMHHMGEAHYAHVIGDELVYKGRAVSPRQFTVMVTGEPRNAWRELWIRLHGQQAWISADKLRNLQPAPVPLSPIETMAVAARTMSAAFESTVTIMHDMHYKMQQHPERRVSRHRRADDILADHCRMD